MSLIMTFNLQTFVYVYLQRNVESCFFKMGSGKETLNVLKSEEGFPGKRKGLNMKQ